MTKRAREAEEMKRRKLVRQHFRSVIRRVVFNRVWLADQGEQKLSLNVKKNIAMLIRSQRQIGTLTLAEKALLHTPHSLRSVQDRKHLVTTLLGLNCFSKLPPKVVARLVPVIHFMFLGPQRIIVKQGDIAHKFCFILSGEVEVARKVFDPMKNAVVQVVEAMCGAGDYIGEMELIENVRRRATCTALSNVELLVVYEEDFDEILKPFMAKRWFDKKRALLALGYFDIFTEEQLTVACKLAVIREFDPLETIYHEDKGHLSYVHFVISGECMILQCLKMKVTQKKGHKTFELVDISKGNADMFQDLTKKEFLKKLKEENLLDKKAAFDIDFDVASNEDIQNQRKKETPMKTMDIKSIEIACGLREPSVESMKVETEERSENVEQLEGETSSFDNEESQASYDYERDSTYSVVSSKTKTRMQGWDDDKFPDDIIESRESKSNMSAQAEQAEQTEQTVPEEQIEGQPAEAILIPNASNEKVASSEKLASEQDSIVESTHLTPTGEKSITSLPAHDDPAVKMENHFIDVGSLTFGGIFGLGEKLEHRVIMARTTVQCLMLPRFFLLERQYNPGNIWQRRRFYLDSTLPSRQTLFQNFLATRKWQKFKNDFIASNLDPNSNINPTKVQDVPIICRIVEATDD